MRSSAIHRKKARRHPHRKDYRIIQAALVERDSSFRQWALEHGYEPRTVTQVVERYAGTTNLPRGRLSFRILVDLSRYLDREIVPGILKEVA